MSIEGIRKHMSSSVKSGIVNSQSKNAAAMGTNSANGTSEGAIRDRMTAMLDGKRYAVDYKYLTSGGYNFTQDEFITYIKNSLAKNGPVIVLINKPFLEYYTAEYKYTSGHYVVVYECVESIGNVTFSVKDPNNWNNGKLCGSHVVSAKNLYSCFIAMSWMK